MGKSRSHPCKHPIQARRDYTEVSFWCHKCKQRVDRTTHEVIKPDASDPVVIAREIVQEEFSNHDGVDTHQLHTLESEGGIVP